MPARFPKVLIEFVLLALLTAGAILVHGYHLGIEDQVIYLPGIAKGLHPGLFPIDSDLFLPQTRSTFLIQFVVTSVQLTGVTLDTAVFAWHVISVFLLLFAARRLACRCFTTPEARWGAVGLLAALLTMPVAGVSLFIAEAYLHPRTLSTASILLAIVAVLDRRFVKAVVYIALAALVHIQMAFYGALLCVFLGWKAAAAEQATAGGGPSAAESAMAVTLFGFPLKHFFEPGSDAWKEASRIHAQHYLLQWEWYEWLGAVAPLALFYWFVNVARKAGLPLVAFVSQRVAAFQIFIIVSALVLTLPPQFERLTPYQPMRGLHTVTLIFVMLAGGLIGQFLLRRSVLRWLLLFMPLCFAMFYVQRQIYPSGAHLELPGRASRNPWIQAFVWIRDNTPQDAYFALDPGYVERPDEDQHGFRAFAQRGMMADFFKDSGVVTLFPSVAERWQKENRARANWNNLSLADFLKLRDDYGVTWVVLEKPTHVLLPCPYQNERIAVCQIGN